MGWKSTKDLTREEAIELINSRLADIDSLDNEALANILEGMGYGEDTNLPYYGHNFYITGVQKEKVVCPHSATSSWGRLVTCLDCGEEWIGDD